MGGYRVQGREARAAAAIRDDARQIAEAGVFAMVLEGLPADLAAGITRDVAVPTIGIGAGPACDGQVLVFHDLLGMSPEPAPKFVRRYAEIYARQVEAIRAFCADVRAGAFPSDRETYR
jgi:3-methyl-2-oxobutanoate hydroxymethyltransferase